MRWAGHITCMGYMRLAYKNFSRKNMKRKIWEIEEKMVNKIKLDLEEIILAI
jgi:hypothetical protein